MVRKKVAREEKINIWHKILLMIILLIYFFAGYFFCQKFYIGEPILGNNFIDDIIPFTPFFMIFYILGYFIVLGPAILINNKKEFEAMFWSFTLIMTISFSIFLILPIEIIRPIPTGDDIFSKLVIQQHLVDGPINTFPSLHVSQDFFAFLIIRHKNKKLGNYLIPLIIPIMLSILFVKQHNFIDLASGIALAYFAYWFFKKKISAVSS